MYFLLSSFIRIKLESDVFVCVPILWMIKAITGRTREDCREVMLVMGIVLQTWDNNKQEMARELLKRVNKGWAIYSKYEVDQSKCILLYYLLYFLHNLLTKLFS